MTALPAAQRVEHGRECNADGLSLTTVQIAVIVNDMAQVNIDASLLRDAAAFRTAEPRLVELTNGCICCSLRADLIEVRTGILSLSLLQNLLQVMQGW
jgi:G3E family GTPase